MEDILKSIGNFDLCPVALIVCNGQILLGHRHYVEKSVWTLPGGRCDIGETVEMALRREVTEEIGVRNLVIKKYLGTYKGAAGSDVVPAFLCELSDEEPLNIESHKFSEWKWFSKGEFPETFINRDIEKLVNSIL
jgi:ADP-ribose pyrophosphatase YjhB (NUDIX family)